MASKVLDALLAELHVQLPKLLLKRIKDGTATAADLAVARQFLKDNGIDGIPKNGTALADLAANVPFKGSEDISDDDLRH